MCAMAKLTGFVLISCSGFSEKIGQLFQQPPFNAETTHTEDGAIVITANAHAQENAKIESALTLNAHLVRNCENAALETKLNTPSSSFQTTRFYGGPPAMADEWAINSLLDQIRRAIKS